MNASSSGEKQSDASNRSANIVSCGSVNAPSPFTATSVRATIRVRISSFGLKLASHSISTNGRCLLVGTPWSFSSDSDRSFRSTPSRGAVAYQAGSGSDLMKRGKRMRQKGSPVSWSTQTSNSALLNGAIAVHDFIRSAPAAQQSLHGPSIFEFRHEPSGHT